MLTLVVTIGSLALVLQLVILGALGPRLLVGDEYEYVSRSRSGDPTDPATFLRPPLMPWLAALCAIDGGERAEVRLRLLMTLASVGSVVLTTVAGWHLGAWPVAVVGGGLLLLHPERLILGCHIWPDSLLAMVVALINLALITPFPFPAFALGIVCAVGVLVRVDAVVLSPLVLLALAAEGGVAATSFLTVAAPSVVVLALLVLRNIRRYGVALPEDTWAFNLMVAAEEIKDETPGEFALEPLIARVSREWSSMTSEGRSHAGLAALWRIVRSPMRFGRSVVRRTLALIGPDTFVSQKLVGQTTVYPRLDSAGRRLLARMLQVASPMLVAAIVVGVFLYKPTAAYAIPSVGLIAVAAFAHVRTRYRVAVLPTFCLLAAQVTVAGITNTDTRTLVVALAAFLLLTGLLSRIHRGTELPPAPSRR
jgi:hypothetical protein